MPQRYVLGMMGFFAMLNAYTLRVSLSVAITEMVPPVEKPEYSGVDYCPDYDIANSTSGPITTSSKLYNWDESTQGLILSSFYWGYLITHLPAGILSERFGGKHTLGLGMLFTSVFTFITPWVIQGTDGNWLALVLLRVIAGLGQGTTYPALNVLLAKWVPSSERAKMGTLVYAGGQIGTVVSNMGSGVLIQHTNQWSSVFYLFGALGIAWFFFWCLLCYSDPNVHPFISDEEKRYLNRELNLTKKRVPVPWRAILTSVPLWALIVSQIGHDWGLFTVMTDLPKYMKDVLKFNVQDNGFWSSVPYVVMWIVSTASSWLCDYLIVRRIFHVTFARKFFTTIATFGPAVFIILASYSGCNRMMAVVMFTIGLGFMGTFFCGMKVNALDLSPNYAGTLMAIVNGIGAFTGIISPSLIGFVTEGHTLNEWRIVFWITFIILVISNIVFMLYGSGEEQWWNNPEERNEKIDITEEGYDISFQPPLSG